MKLYDFGLAVIFHAVGIAVTPQRELGERDHSFSGKNHHEKKKKSFLFVSLFFKLARSVLSFKWNMIILLPFYLKYY